MNRAALLSILLLCGCSDGAAEAEGVDTGPSTSPSDDTGSLPADDVASEEDTSVAVDSATTDAGSPSDMGVDAPPEDPTFSFVVIPDTQNEVLSDTTAEKHFNHRIKWILANRDKLDIRFALQTGDLCNWDTPTHDQYVRASNGLKLFDDAKFTYALTIGNHDSAATCTGGSACPGDTHANQRKTTTFNTYFPTTRFPTMSGTFEPGKVDNAFHLVHAGGVDWIIIAMELWPRPEAYQWVGKVLAEHPKHNGIIFTHSHLTGAGTIKTDNGGYGDTAPKKVFDDMMVKQPNLRFVFNGHEGLLAFRQDAGLKGNQIYQFLFNEDDTTNPTRIIQIDTSKKTIDSYVYGPATDKTYTEKGATVHLEGVSFVH